jgi:hypothetical protein
MRMANLIMAAAEQPRDAKDAGVVHPQGEGRDKTPGNAGRKLHGMVAIFTQNRFRCNSAAVPRPPGAVLGA